MYKFDANKFLSLPLNDGSSYIDKNGCGCIKGVFAQATEDFCKIDSVSIKDTCGKNIEIYGTDEDICNSGSLDDKRLQAVLDRGERLLLGGQKGDKRLSPTTLAAKPQYAKLVVLRALRMFKLVEFINESAVEEQKNVLSAV